MTDMNLSEKVIRRLYEITHNYELGFETQIEQILAMGLERFNLDIGILAKVHNSEYTVKHCIVPENMLIAPGQKFDLNNTLCQITCEAKVPVALEHIGKHERFATHPAYLSGGLESYIAVPINVSGKLYGTINFSSITPYERKFKDVDIDALQLMASWIEVEIIRRRQEERLIELNLALEKKAYEDSLTLIPNRRACFRYLSAEVNRIQRENSSAVLAMIDVDNFKKVNDTHGHQKGDEILKAIAASVENVKRDYDFLARVGGEEFLLWLPNSDKASATKVCARIRESIEKLAILNTPITISVGLALYTSTDIQKVDTKTEIDRILSQADKALYGAKNAGRNCIYWHEPAA